MRAITMNGSNASPPETVVLWGASGFIGRNLANHLRPRVKNLITIKRGEEKISLPEGRAVAVNLAAERYDASRFQNYQSHIFAQNVGIATRFYHFCLEHGIREARVASSIAVYAGEDTLLDDEKPLSASLPAASEAMYGCSKRITEEIGALYREKYGISTIFFRLSNPYGPHDSINEERAHVPAAFVMRALTTEGPFRVRGGPDATRDFIYAEDVCEIIARSLSWEGMHDAYNLATGANTRIVDLAKQVIKLTNPGREILFEGAPTSSVVHRVCKADKLKRDFALKGFTPLQEGLLHTINWYRTAIG